MKASSLLPLILMMPLLSLVVSATAQNTGTQLGKKTASTRVSPAVERCHTRIAPLKGKDSEFFSLMSVSELRELHDAVDACLRGSYKDLSKLDLAVAAETLDWTRYFIDQKWRSEPPGATKNDKTPAQINSAQVRAEKEAANLKICMDGRFAALCNHSLLTPEQARAVAAREMNAASVRSTAPAVRTPRLRGSRGNCESGLSIVFVGGDGKIIKLDDGSIWEVDDVDTVDTALWLPTSDVVVCDGKMINVDDNETAEVTPVR